MTDDYCYKLYMHVNKTNDKLYIGQTKQSYVSRWDNGKGYGHCSRFAKAIKKYGWDGFEHISLIEGLSKSEADYFERFFIAFFDSQNPEFGYNLTAGGDENPMDNPVVRATHDESMKKIHADPKWQKNHREAMKKLSADPKWQENQRVGAKKRATNPEWRKNVCEANQKNSADPEWQKNHREFLKKLHSDPKWQEKHREGMKKMSANPEWQKNHREFLKKLHSDPKWQEKVREANQKRCKKVLCVETKIVYDSLKEAVIAVNLKTHTSISMCCGGKRKTAGGYHWEYV